MIFIYFKTMKNSFVFLALVNFSGLASAATTMISANVYQVDAGVTFNISNSGASDYLFSWADGGTNFTNIADATFILTAGETYNFLRTTSAHPFVITDDTLPVSGSDGSFSRTTTDGAVIDNSTLAPIADFTADPAPTTDQIVWATGAGNYFYTCRVTGHTGMTGSIQVIPEPSSTLLSCVGIFSALLLRRSRRS